MVRRNTSTPNTRLGASTGATPRAARTRPVSTGSAATGSVIGARPSAWTAASSLAPGATDGPGVVPPR